MICALVGMCMTSTAKRGTAHFDSVLENLAQSIPQDYLMGGTSWDKGSSWMSLCDDHGMSVRQTTGSWELGAAACKPAVPALCYLQHPHLPDTGTAPGANPPGRSTTPTRRAA